MKERRSYSEMDKLLEEIKQGIDVRANLIALRKELKQATSQQAKCVNTENALWKELLQHEDPKVRKNAALLIGDIYIQELIEDLYQAYIQEETLFVRSDYLKAMSQLDFSEYQEKLQARLKEMQQQEVAEDGQKHYREELTALQKMLLLNTRKERHTFTGINHKYDVILTTNRNFREVTARQVTGKQISLVPLGVKVRQADIVELQKVRTFRDMLFVLNIQTVGPEPKAAAEALATSDLLELLARAHGINGPFYFRFSISGPMPLDKRSIFIKKCSFELEQRSGRKLINTASDYEIEIQLLERKDGTFLPLVKMCTWQDLRFSYRKESIATSIHPSVAALIAELAKPYLKENVQVLDPFCGVGTMLIERDKIVAADPVYGTDIFGEAIRKARENTTLADREFYYIQRNFFDFKHQYLFDEIFTNMPVRNKKTKEEQEELYRKFFRKASEVLKVGGVMILYSNEKGYIKKQLRLREEWKMLKEFCLNEKEEFSVYIIMKRA